MIFNSWNSSSHRGNWRWSNSMYERVLNWSCWCNKSVLLTIPILLVALIILVVLNCVILSTELHAIIVTIPNIVCAYIFPTNICATNSTIYGLTYWICDIIVTYSLPLLIRLIGLAGIFGICAIYCFFLCYLWFAR
jgi:hypothetical protein